MYLQTRVIGVLTVRDSDRAFVDAEEGADTVTGAVSEIESDFPQELPRKRVEQVAGRLVGKDGGGEVDVTLQHAGESLFLQGLRSAEMDSSGTEIE